MAKKVVGVMGASANDGLTEAEQKRVAELAQALGLAIAKRDCVLVTGATTGFPDLVAQAFRKAGGFSLGISPATSHREHVRGFGLPESGADVMVYTGFGYKGRNVINIRSSDIVIIFGGATGTLNEFTIAYDEGKIIGVLEGSGGIADHIEEIVRFCNKPAQAALLYGRDPEDLIEKCLAELELG
jgi:uncharacterized protein (TIGR00725 family)